MADGKQFEYGQSASEVQFQDEIGKLKNRQGEACLEVTDDQNVGIGTASPDRKLEVLHASDPQLRLTQADGSKFTDLKVDSAGKLNVQSTAVAAMVVRSSNNNSNIYITANDDDYDQSLTTGPTLVLGVNEPGAYGRLMMYGGTLGIGVAGASDAITIDGSKNATFIANLNAAGNVTLGDTDADVHTVNGTLAVLDGLTYKPKATVDAGTSGTDVELVDSGTSFVLTDKDGYCTLPVGTASDIGVQFVIFNASDEDNPDCIRRGGSDDFYHADEVDGTSDNQEVGGMKAKTVICFAANSWIVIG